MTAPWAVGSRSASTPTQVKTRNAKATIVSTIMLRPRIAGRNRACSSTAKTSHITSALRTFGSVQRITCAEASAPRRQAQDHADQQPERQQREGDA